MAATVRPLEYDPYRTAFIALVKYTYRAQAYILAPQRLAVGDTVIAGNYVDVKPGNVMPLGNMPIGTIIHNVELKIGKGGQLARSAGKPHNRGVSMNPVDHPHGGGEGRTSGGRHPVPPWGKPTKGKKARSNKSTNRFILISRHKRKK